MSEVQMTPDIKTRLADKRNAFDYIGTKQNKLFIENVGIKKGRKFCAVLCDCGKRKLDWERLENYSAQLEACARNQRLREALEKIVQCDAATDIMALAKVFGIAGKALAADDEGKG